MKNYRKKFLIGIIFVIVLSVFYFLSLRYFAHAHKIVAYVDHVTHFFKSVKESTNQDHKKSSPSVRQEPNIKVDFEFYSALSTMRVKVPNMDRMAKENMSIKNKNKEKLIKAEELENDVLKHIK